jgi:hypothetical protein
LPIAESRNRFVDQEFLDQTRETASHLVSDFDYIRDFVGKRPAYQIEEQLKDKIRRLTDLITFNIMRGIDNIAILPADQGLKEAYRLVRRLSRYNEIFFFMKQAIDQRFQTHVTEQFHFLQPAMGECTGRKIYGAIDNLVAKLMKSFFPRFIAGNSISLVVFTYVPGYGVWIPFREPIIAIVQIPTVDLHRCRFWTSLAHETAHERYAAYPLEDLDPMGDKYFNLKMEMVPDLMNMFSQIFRETSQETARFMALSQFEEILCDLSSLMLVGPAEVLTLMTTFADPRLEADAFGRHPPLAARVEYMLEYLDTTFQSAPSDNFKYDLEAWKASWAFVKETIPNPVRERLYLDSFSRVFANYKNDLIAVARDFLKVPDSELFKPEIWDRATRAWDDTNRSYSLSGTDYINVIWAKRWKLFKEIFRGSTAEFLNWHEYERKSTYDVITELYGGET